MAKILLVEDDRSFAKLVIDWLSFEHHIVEWAETDQKAVELLARHEFDVLILDLSLSGTEDAGLNILRRYRESGGPAPVLILTAFKHIDTKVEGFASGADDYLTKPFEVEELSARVSALLRRPPLKYDKKLKVNSIELDPANRLVKVSGEAVSLDPIEFSMLEFFMRNTNHVFSQKEIFDWVWPNSSSDHNYAVSSCIKRLRQKITPHLKSEKELIRTVYGAGYCMDGSS